MAQLRANPRSAPAAARAIRDSALVAIVLVDGQVDHTTGLYMLRESARPWPIWCTDSTYADLTRGNPIFGVLNHFCGVDRRRIDLDPAGFRVDAVPGVRWRALAVASTPAPYSPNRDSPIAEHDNLALAIEDDGSAKPAVYAPGLSVIDEALWRAMQAAACVLVDGTFWTDDEMIRLGISSGRAFSISGTWRRAAPAGTLQWLDRLPSATRRILIHINNTNPILDEGSAESAELARRCGIEVAWDGVEVNL